MDTSSPAVFVNSQQLKMYLGQRVRMVIQVGRIDSGTMVGQSTDGHQLIVKGSPAFPLLHFAEVIGIADGNQSIRAEICTDFGESFDTMAYNRLSTCKWRAEESFPLRGACPSAFNSIRF